MYGLQVTAPRSAGARPGRADVGGNTLTIRLEYAIVVTFLYGQAYVCVEFCKYLKNIENLEYKFIPSVNQTTMTATSAT